MPALALIQTGKSLDTARRRLDVGDKRASETLDRGITHLSGAIQEVRRISRDLRPGALDDLGLGPALKALAEDFGNQYNICGLRPPHIFLPPQRSFVPLHQSARGHSY